MFWLTCGLCCFGAAIFVIFGTGVQQDWSKESKSIRSMLLNCQLYSDQEFLAPPKGKVRQYFSSTAVRQHGHGITINFINFVGHYKTKNRLSGNLEKLMNNMTKHNITDKISMLQSLF